jgi:Polyketide cyclase / dehydrase and lipid transport
MVELHLVRDTTAPPAVVWAVVTDFAAYGQWMPLTRMSLDDGAPRPGWGFAAVSGPGPLCLRDPMLVTQWSVPSDLAAGRFRVVKTGRVLGGWAQVGVGGHGEGARLDWRQDLVVRPLPFRRLLDPAVRRVGEWLYGRALDAMVDRAEQLHARAPQARERLQ